jgi:hypothetical protein
VSETDKRLRERLIASGQLRPNTKELDHIQLNPGALVFRIESEKDRWDADARGGYRREYLQ